MALGQKVQGLNIKLSADTSAIDSALKDLNKSISSTKRELKEVDKLLKYDPKNITLLTQKQGLLTNAINDTKSKLEQLTKAQELANKEGLAQKNAKAYDELARKVEEAKQQLKYFETQQKQTTSALDEASDSTSTFKDTLKALLTGDVIKMGLNALKSGIEAVASAVKGLAQGLYSLVKQGVEYNATMETFNVSIKAMLNDDEEATKTLIKAMKELGALSGYSNEALLEGARNLLSADISAEKTAKTIEGLAKAITYVGGSNDDLSRMITNLQGIASTGKATAQDIKQFKNIGLNVSKLIADQMGKTTEEVEKQGITFEMLSEAFIKASQDGGKFASAFEVQANTFQTQANKLSSNWEQLLGNLTTDTTSAISQTILPAINGLLEDMNKSFEEEGMVGLVNSFNEGLGSVIETLSSEGVIEQVLSGATNIIDTLASAFEDEKNQEALQKATASLLDAIGRFIDLNYDSIKDLGKTMARPIIEGVKEALSDYFWNLGIDQQDGVWFNGQYFDTSQYHYDRNKLKFGSMGYGSLASGGYASGGITLNASFNMNNTELNEGSAKLFAKIMAEEINNELGGMI